MPKIYESGILSKLGDMSGQHKLLYLALWELANPLGIVEVNLAELGALAGDYRFHRSDITALGNRVVWLDQSRILLPTYLKTTIGRLSKASRGQKKIFELIQQEWGATKENLGPFYEAWNGLGIGTLAPPSIGTYQGENMPLPQFLIDHREEAENAAKVMLSGVFPPEIANHFKQYMDEMYYNAMKQTTLSGCYKYEWKVSIVLDNESAIQDAINRGVPEYKIISAIRKAKNKHYVTILI